MTYTKLTFNNIDFPFVLFKATWTEMLKSDTWFKRSLKHNSMCQRHPSLASITIFGWNTTQFGESSYCIKEMVIKIIGQ